ncbi:hypothetical protein BU107_10665 [Staphylococcus xylosus]|uniref:hypothetical protein n=1 Tax=Staphylococcus xylosus TaxID=1288 RepID=UPI000E67759C|nr:hypothetical protein [Staphylococcus xylosus]RIM86012.1 hypothetical protein BU107_10665 [Staphylococcus xylosus]
MKEHKFKRMAIDLIARIEDDRCIVEYKKGMIVFIERQDLEFKALYITNHKRYDKENQAKHELAKKVIARERQLTEEDCSDAKY